MSNNMQDSNDFFKIKSFGLRIVPENNKEGGRRKSVGGKRM